MNTRGILTFGLENNISFLHSAHEGDILTAEAFECFNHHKIPYYEIKVKNQNEELICAMSALAYRKGGSLPIE